MKILVFSLVIKFLSLCRFPRNIKGINLSVDRNTLHLDGWKFILFSVAHVCRLEMFFQKMFKMVNAEDVNIGDYVMC